MSFTHDQHMRTIRNIVKQIHALGVSNLPAGLNNKILLAAALDGIKAVIDAGAFRSAISTAMDDGLGVVITNGQKKVLFSRAMQTMIDEGLL